ncbi:hypothetical protein BGX23_005440 [Mortierella sp. AD031]|nr:hypothetical protein BGX23_005440 [Mortierella sp. AD031]
MSSTAPQTKESLMAGQEELVQCLEDRVIKDLRDWVNGVGRNNSKGMTVNAEGLFLDGDEFEGEDDEGSEDGFHMASLSFEDADDDDEDHEEDSLASKSIITTTKLQRRDASPSTGTSPREYFLSADKSLMRQEWSRWIAHWVHHKKLLILSHTLSTQSLVEMNQITVSGENVVPVDQRHWSWNLDKALATVMVASEMICGGPASSKDVKVFLSTLSVSVDGDGGSTVAATGSNGNGGDYSSSSEMVMMSQKALAITLNAQRCIESWSEELEEILQRTATNA